jgi:hypothetical protein
MNMYTMFTYTVKSTPNRENMDQAITTPLSENVNRNVITYRNYGCCLAVMCGCFPCICPVCGCDKCDWILDY